MHFLLQQKNNLRGSQNFEKIACEHHYDSHSYPPFSESCPITVPACHLQDIEEGPTFPTTHCSIKGANSLCQPFLSFFLTNTKNKINDPLLLQSTLSLKSSLTCLIFSAEITGHFYLFSHSLWLARMPLLWSDEIHSCSARDETYTISCSVRLITSWLHSPNITFRVCSCFMQCA